MTLTEIQYKWEMGVLSIEDMRSLVDHKKITKEDFFEITRTYYKEEVL